MQVRPSGGAASLQSETWLIAQQQKAPALRARGLCRAFGEQVERLFTNHCVPCPNGALASCRVTTCPARAANLVRDKTPTHRLGQPSTKVRSSLRSSQAARSHATPTR